MTGEGEAAEGLSILAADRRDAVGEREMRAPRAGEFFAPLPLAALALTVVNDVWLKRAFHSELTGKLSDIGICFFMPLFVAELLGIVFGTTARLRLWVGAIVTAVLYIGQEVVPPFTRFALAVLRTVGPRLGIHGHFGLTSDWTDLFCLVLIPLAVVYGRRRVERLGVVRSTGARRGATISAGASTL